MTGKRFADFKVRSQGRLFTLHPVTVHAHGWVVDNIPRERLEFDEDRAVTITVDRTQLYEIYKSIQEAGLEIEDETEPDTAGMLEWVNKTLRLMRGER